MLSKYTVNHPITMLIVFLLLLIVGIYASFDLATDLYPEINYPVLLVFTNYSGSGPEEIEKNITRPLESVLSNVGNVEKITSTSLEGGSQILIQFTWGTNLSNAANDVRDKIDLVRNYLPDDAEVPMIFKFDPSMIPILFYIVTGNRSPEELRKISEDIIQPRLEQVEGVAMASVSGGRERLIRVEIPQNRLEAYNLTLTQVSNMLIGQNVQISAGSITEGNKNYLVRTSGEYMDIEQIKNTVVGYKSGNTLSLSQMNSITQSNQLVVRLRDIANVYDGLKKEESAVYVNGKPGVYISVQKQSGKNSVRTASNVKEKVKKITPEIPSGININLVDDTTKIIKNSLNSVIRSLIEGAILSILVLFLFLRSMRGIIIMGVSLPLSVIITLMLMYFFHLTLNIMTLAGLGLGIGKLVDDSIIIFENIYRYRTKGAKHSVAAIVGSQEMMTAVVASTLTSICVYAPVILFKSQLGMIGELFASLAFTVVISLAASLLVALFLVPVLASKYLPIRTRLEDPLHGIPKQIDDFLENAWNKLSTAYKKALKFVLANRKKTILIIAGALIVSFVLIGFVGLEFMPEAGEDSVTLLVELPVGTKLDETKNMMNQIETLIKKEIKGYNDVIVSCGEKSFFGFLGATESHKGSLIITLPEFSKRKDNSVTIKQKLRKHFNDFPSATITFQSQNFGGSTSPIDILVKSNDYQRSKYTAEKIRNMLKDKVPEVTEPVIDLKDGLPQIEVIIDRDKAYSLGLNVYSIGQELKANIDGIVSSKYKENGSEYDILVILDPKDRQSLPDLEKIFIINSLGKKIPLSNFARLEKTTGPINIKRENQTRVIHITGGLSPKANLNTVEMKIRKLVKQEVPQDDNLVIEFSGDFAELMKNLQKFMIVLLIAMALVFGVMASQFESLIDPFIIFFTVPLSIIGISLIHFITGTKLSIYTAVGMVVLLGIVVNNGIILVDYTNLMRSRGLSIFDAVIEACGNRLRPVLMTTLTMVLGLIPMAFFEGEGTSLSQPLAKTIFGGLTVCTIFTLFLIPVIYSIFNEFSDKRIAKKEAKSQQRLEYRKNKLMGKA